MLIHKATVEITEDDIQNYDLELYEEYIERGFYTQDDLYTKEIVEDFEDVLAFLYEQWFGVPYHINTYTLEKGGKAFVLDLENKWFKNELDTESLYLFNDDFKQWLERRYIPNAKLDFLVKRIEEMQQELDDEDWYN